MIKKEWRHTTFWEVIIYILRMIIGLAKVDEYFLVVFQHTLNLFRGGGPLRWSCGGWAKIIHQKKKQRGFRPRPSECDYSQSWPNCSSISLLPTCSCGWLPSHYPSSLHLLNWDHLLGALGAIKSPTRDTPWHVEGALPVQNLSLALFFFFNFNLAAPM